MADCIFCKIRDRKIPSNIIYEDEDVMVFPDIHAVRAVHLLIVPKKHVEDLLDTDSQTIEQLFSAVQKMAKEKGLAQRGYRMVINGGGAQIVQHLHMHLMGPMTPKDSL